LADLPPLLSPRDSGVPSLPPLLVSPPFSPRDHLSPVSPGEALAIPLPGSPSGVPFPLSPTGCGSSPDGKLTDPKRMVGFLEKRTRDGKWVPLFIELYRECLLYFDPIRTKPSKIIYLRLGASVRVQTGVSSKRQFVVKDAPGVMYEFRAPTTDMRRAWVTAIGLVLRDLESSKGVECIPPAALQGSISGELSA